MWIAAATTTMASGSLASYSSINSSVRCMNLGMHEVVEDSQTVAIGEDFESQQLAIDFAVRTENTAAEFADNRVIGGPVGQKHFVTEHVGFDQPAAKIFERCSYKTLTAGQAARQSDCQHDCRRSAESIVFTISVAIVIGPTPPGTGV